jgi:hypothetical protein
VAAEKIGHSRKPATSACTHLTTIVPSPSPSTASHIGRGTGGDTWRRRGASVMAWRGSRGAARRSNRGFIVRPCERQLVAEDWQGGPTWPGSSICSSGTITKNQNTINAGFTVGGPWGRWLKIVKKAVSLAAPGQQMTIDLWLV